MDGRRNNKGTIGNKGGRPSKADEQKLVEKLAPLEAKALKALENAIQDEQSWSIKLFFQYMYGNPKQISEVEVTTNKLPIEFQEASLLQKALAFGIEFTESKEAPEEIIEEVKPKIKKKNDKKKIFKKDDSKKITKQPTKPIRQTLTPRPPRVNARFNDF